MTRSSLETFPNPRLGRDYEIAIRCPEFTSICPKTGLPDFGVIRITYVPGAPLHGAEGPEVLHGGIPQWGIFYEAVTNQILDDLVAACQPASHDRGGRFLGARRHHDHGHPHYRYTRLLEHAQG